MSVRGKCMPSSPRAMEYGVMGVSSSTHIPSRESFAGGSIYSMTFSRCWSDQLDRHDSSFIMSQCAYKSLELACTMSHLLPSRSRIHSLLRAMLMLISGTTFFDWHPCGQRQSANSAANSTPLHPPFAPAVFPVYRTWWYALYSSLAIHAQPHLERSCNNIIAITRRSAHWRGKLHMRTVAQAPQYPVPEPRCLLLSAMVCATIASFSDTPDSLQKTTIVSL